MPTQFKVTVPLNIPRALLWRLRATRALSNFLVSAGALRRMDAGPPRPHPASPTARTRRQVYVPADVALPDVVRALLDDALVEVTDDQVWDDAREPFAQHSLIRPGVLSDVVTTSLTLSLEPDPSNPLALPAPAKAPRPAPAPPLSASPSSVRDAAPALAGDLATIGDENKDSSNAAPDAVDDDDDDDDDDKAPVEARCGCLHTLAGQCSVAIPFVGYYVEQAVVANMRDFYDMYPKHFEQFLDMFVSKYGDGTRASLPAAVDALLAEEAKEERS